MAEDPGQGLCRSHRNAVETLSHFFMYDWQAKCEARKRIYAGLMMYFQLKNIKTDKFRFVRIEIRDNIMLRVEIMREKYLPKSLLSKYNSLYNPFMYEISNNPRFKIMGD